MTFQELSVLCFFCFLFLTFCKSKIITKYKVMKKKRKEKATVQFTPGEWGHLHYKDAGLGFISPDFPPLMDFIISSGTDIT